MHQRELTRTERVSPAFQKFYPQNNVFRYHYDITIIK